MTFKPEHLSPNSWNLWDQCPRQWAAKYLHCIREPTNPAMETGTLAHTTLEVLYASESHERTLGRARQIAAELWADEMPSTVADGMIDPIDFKRAAWKGIEGDFVIEDPTTVDVVAVEHHAKWTENGVPFYCIVDRVERSDVFPGLVVADYKTGKLPKKKEYGYPAQRQVVISAMGVAATLDGGCASSGNVLYTSAEKVVSVSTSLASRHEVAVEAGKVWDDMVAACEANDSAQGFEAKAGPLCSWCAFADQCREGRSRVESDLSRGYMKLDDAIGANLVMGTR